MNQYYRVKIATVAATMIALGLLSMGKYKPVLQEFLLTDQDNPSDETDQLRRNSSHLNIHLNQESEMEEKDKSRPVIDHLLQRLKELQTSLDRLWCKTVKIGSTGGFCLTEDDISVGGNIQWDIKLCQDLEQLFGHTAVVDLGAGLGHYGKCFLRKKESIFITKQNKISRRIHNEYIHKMGDLIKDPQIIKSWNGYDGAINVGYLSKGFIKQQDLSVADLWLGRTWDWVLSLEVGEHVPAPYEDIFIDNLVKHGCQGIVLSWSLENQGGHHHVNERSNEHIKQKMAERGLINDINAEWQLRENTSYWYFKNTLMVFRYPLGYKC